MTGEVSGSGIVALAGGRFVGLVAPPSGPAISIGVVTLGTSPGVVTLAGFAGGPERLAERPAPLAMAEVYVHAARTLRKWVSLVCDKAETWRSDRYR